MPLTRLDGKVAVVTGGASVIGAAVVRRLSDEGARLVVDRAIESAQELVGSLGGEAIAIAQSRP
jgi:NAD(P)-dependent dehydrogenase (short-subunit alcohol dehydrogenase family)